MKSSVKYGLILGGVLSAIPLIIYGVGMEKNDTLQNVAGFANIAITAVIIFLGIKERRDVEGNGFMSFGNGFSAGMIIASVGGLISAVFSFLYFKVINPGMITYIQMK